MQNSLTKISRCLARNNRGAEIAETAMILPLLFVVLMAIFWFGQAFRLYGTITHAAREGARAAVAPACATCTATSAVQNATNAVASALTAANLSPAQAAAPTTVPNLCQCQAVANPNTSCTAGNVVPCQSVSASNVCVQPNVQLSYPANGGAGTCGTSVSFSYKYPFHFTLPCWPQPCTSLDLSKITLPAQAEMRLETQ
jgi:Flp pilus assembly protein TadG